MRPQKRKFHIGDVLSITGGRLVSRAGYDGMRDALSHVAGEEIYTHQIGRVMDEATPVILAKYPLLTGIIAPEDVTEATLDPWLEDQSRIYGEYLTLPRMTIEQHQRIDPLSEGIENKHPDHVRAIIAPPRSSERLEKALRRRRDRSH